jgi:hypothetical protein
MKIHKVNNIVLELMNDIVLEKMQFEGMIRFILKNFDKYNFEASEIMIIREIGMLFNKEKELILTFEHDNFDVFIKALKVVWDEEKKIGLIQNRMSAMYINILEKILLKMANNCT